MPNTDLSPLPQNRLTQALSLVTRVLLVLLAAPALLAAAAAALAVSLLTLPLLLLGKAGPRPALRWHGRSKTSEPQNWAFEPAAASRTS